MSPFTEGLIRSNLVGVVGLVAAGVAATIARLLGLWEPLPAFVALGAFAFVVGAGWP